jgi:hypothetical protein
MPRQHLDPTRTSWHITWGTYGSRLHGGPRPTVDRDHNERGEPFVAPNSQRERDESSILNFPPRLLTLEQRTLVEGSIPAICIRGGWNYRVCAAGPDQVHVLCDIVPAVHGEKARRLLKRWIGQELAKLWPLEQGQTWWAEEGSNIAVKDEAYLNNVFNYILRRRTTPFV